MLGYVITQDGKSQATLAQVYKGCLVEPGTTMPIINEVKLTSHPERDGLTNLIEEARPAAHAIGELVSRTRRHHRAQSLTEDSMTKEIRKELRGRRQEEYNARFTELKFKPSAEFPDGAGNAIEALWKNPALRTIAIQAPRQNLLIDKIAENDFNFTPREVKEILTTQGGLATIEAYGGQEVARALMCADVEGRYIAPDERSPFVREFLTILRNNHIDEAIAYLESDRTPPATHMLNYRNFKPIQALLEAELIETASKMVEFLPVEQRVSVNSQLARSSFRHASLTGNLGLFRLCAGMVDNSTMKEKNWFSEAFYLACRKGNLNIVEFAVTCMKPPRGGRAYIHFDNQQRKKIIKRGFMAACDAGQKDVAGYLRPMVAGKQKNRAVTKSDLFSQPLPTSSEKGEIAGAEDQPLSEAEQTLKLQEAIEIPPEREPTKPQDAKPLDTIVAPEKRFAAFNQEMYDELLPWMLIGTQLYNISNPEQRTYCLSTLFESADEAKQFIRRNMRGTKSQAHGFDIATNIEIPAGLKHEDVLAWRRITRIYGLKAAALIPYALDIKAEFAEHNKKLIEEGANEWEFGKSALADLYKWRDAALAKRDPQYIFKLNIPELEEFGRRWKVPASMLNYCKEPYLKRRKLTEQVGLMEDSIPDIGIISGDQLGHPSFYMMKLPKDDTRGLIIPHFIPGTCTGPTSNLGKAHMLHPEVGLYVIMNKTGADIDPENDRIVAKGSVLRGYTNGQPSNVDVLAFNAWERTKEASHLCEPFYRAAAIKAMQEDASISRVVMGKTITGYPRAEWKAFPELATHERVMLVHNSIPPGDMSRGQYLIASRERDLPKEEVPVHAAPSTKTDRHEHDGVIPSGVDKAHTKPTGASVAA